MNLWVKICANTTLEDARLAVDAGADAVGFVFAPSPRRVTADLVAQIVPRLAKNVEKIGVFVESTLDEIVATVRTCGLTGVQLHSDAAAGIPRQLRGVFGSELRILRVVHFGEGAAEQVAALDRNPDTDGVLLDSRTATAAGGTGIAFDWAEAQRTVFSQRVLGTNLIVAGGLNPSNVADAVARLRPWGVDVASGVERMPGKKDPAKVIEFIRAARVASGQNG